MDRKTVSGVAVAALVLSLVAIVVALARNETGMLPNDDDVRARLDVLEADFDYLADELDERDERLVLVEADVRLLHLRNKFEEGYDFDDLAEEVQGIHERLMDAFDIDDDLVPARWEDVEEAFFNLERLIRNGDSDAVALIDVMVDNVRYHTNVTPYESCHDVGGEWREMPTACVDYCFAPDVCAQVLTFGCDCGPGFCWNGFECQPIES